MSIPDPRPVKRPKPPLRTISAALRLVVALVVLPGVAWYAYCGWAALFAVYGEPDFAEEISVSDEGERTMLTPPGWALLDLAGYWSAAGGPYEFGVFHVPTDSLPARLAEITVAEAPPSDQRGAPAGDLLRQLLLAGARVNRLGERLIVDLQLAQISVRVVFRLSGWGNQRGIERESEPILVAGLVAVTGTEGPESRIVVLRPTAVSGATGRREAASLPIPATLTLACQRRAPSGDKQLELYRGATALEPLAALWRRSGWDVRGQVTSDNLNCTAKKSGRCFYVWADVDGAGWTRLLVRPADAGELAGAPRPASAANF